jgi:hypothetical protein
LRGAYSDGRLKAVEEAWIEIDPNFAFDDANEEGDLRTNVN